MDRVHLCPHRTQRPPVASSVNRLPIIVFTVPPCRYKSTRPIRHLPPQMGAAAAGGGFLSVHQREFIRHSVALHSSYSSEQTSRLRELCPSQVRSSGVRLCVIGSDAD
ncbi:hypothetical protein F2P81_005369 [Scophthalmus maximus]|uniref:Uncharacterized protein n=1 Tax=Scophthalmus maximus TaxID=52904 RepID=A0A6A4T6A4_SCOMX|nr:hypothetical protein F2P81_005369 [Scophthalmus maximus]